MTALRLPISIVLSLLSLSLFCSCATGFQTIDPRSDDDDSLAGDNDDSAPGDDDDSLAGDDDDSQDNFEGDQPGECADGADNDQDGLFDCDDPNCAGSPDCAGDDDSSPNDGSPIITNVTYVWIPGTSTFEFSIQIEDYDCDLTPVTLFYAISQNPLAPLAPAGDASPNCATTYTFDLQILNAAPGLSYPVTLAVEDSAGNRSQEYSLVAQVPS